jgi:hypothetical protein
MRLKRLHLGRYKFKMASRGRATGRQNSSANSDAADCLPAGNLHGFMHSRVARDAGELFV